MNRSVLHLVPVRRYRAKEEEEDDDTKIVKSCKNDFSRGELEGAYEVFGYMFSQISARTLLLVCFEGLVSHSDRVFKHFVWGSHVTREKMQSYGQLFRAC